MREQLSQYVGLLFAGTTGMDEIRQEILQNSLDRFDDLVAQGKSPEAAYRLTISGIGDINEILGQPTAPKPDEPVQAPAAPVPENIPTPAAAPEEPESKLNKLLRSIAISLYILCAIPVIFFEEIGLCITLVMVAIATGILVYIGKDQPEKEPQAPSPVPASFPPAPKKKSKGRKIVSAIIWLAGLSAYLILSFATNGWFITWLVFPMTGCVNGIARGIFDLKEACRK